ncbi:Aste57867_7176 [Aphanomyces stellatus]|uniref:Aste57867_7176 protein n=1 Tax=Aphanomyces stellatus TaxID=120398 RepID=A0A485KGX4_9STRA|nr:hypothetical protein As57867_007151 [Aphanomyces stellatus]VFT84104.1 Aste57867_7176 [Aphanomyces stellatus]
MTSDNSCGGEKRPNTAGVGLRKQILAQVATVIAARPGSAEHLSSPAVILGSDPAAVSQPSITKPPTHLKIADIVNRNRRKTSSSADLIKDFEHAIRKVVDGKRNESDRLKFLVEKKREELGKLKLVLQDLRTDCAALGMNEYPDATDRLQPITSVSRRPVYAKKSNIAELEELLHEKSLETAAVLRKTLTFEHIKKRHVVEKFELLQTNNDLTNHLRETHQRLQELHRVEISANESLNQAQVGLVYKTRLSQLKADIAAEIRLYETELELRLRWAKEKAKFEAFYAKQVGSIDSLVEGLERPGSPGGSERRKLPRAKTVKHWTHGYTGAQLDAARKEEQHHEDAFRRLGLPQGTIDPKGIIEMCMTHDTLKKELLQRQSEQVALTTATWARIEEVKTEIQQSQVGTMRTTEKDLDESHAELAAAEKRLNKAREEYEYMQQMMQPVKAGIQQIVGQVIGKTIDVDSMHAIHDALTKVEHELKTIVPDLTEPGEGEDSNGDINSKLNAPSISKLTPSEITSPYNIRIRPKEQWKASMTTSTKHTKKHKDSGDTHADETEVMDRTTVKQLASTMTTQINNAKKKQVQEGL